MRLTPDMRMRPSDINVAGAVDLSGLRPPTAAPSSGGTPGAGGVGTAGTELVFDVTEAEFEDRVLRRSLQVPVLVDFWASWCGPCKQLSPLLEKLAAEGNGSWALAKIDVDANQGISGQLQIQSIPTVMLAIGGRLIQGFTGALPEQDLRSFLQQVLAAAEQAGLSGPGGAPSPELLDEGPAPEPEVLVAEEALEQGDFAAAEAAYDALLARTPGDAMAQAGRASVALFRRTEGIDPQAVLDRAAASPSDVAAQLAAADVEVLSDQVEAAIARLVTAVRTSQGEDRDAVRERLLELFLVLPGDDPRVVAGRRSLASALF